MVKVGSGQTGMLGLQQLVTRLSTSLTMIFRGKNIIDDGKIITSTFRRSYLLLNLGRKEHIKLHTVSLTAENDISGERSKLQ
jgi:hypothetical protein